MKTNIGCKSFSNFNLWREERRLAASKRVWAVGLGVGLAVVLVFSWRGVGAQLQSVDSIWQRTERKAEALRLARGVPKGGLVWRLEELVLQRLLRGDGETSGRGDRVKEGSEAILSLPMPNGSLARFWVVESPVMGAELAARFPEIKSYRGWGVDNPALTMRCDLSLLGFHAMITDGAELIAIHPVSRDDKEHYVSYAGKDYRVAAEEARCLVNDAKVRRRITPLHSVNSSVGEKFRDYDIAIVTTGEYALAYGGSPYQEVNVIGSLNTWVNELNLIFDRELAIRFNLADGNEELIYTNPATDPFTNGNVDEMVDEVRSVLANANGLGQYNLGLVLGTPVGTPDSYGSAYVGVVCETASDSFGPFKGGGAVLVNDAAGNPASLKLMAHEIGHQFGATHTQNADCGLRVGDTAYESGSGLTLMSNAGGCGADNIATARSSYFHSGSFEQIVGFLNLLGGSCAVLNDASNNPPMVNGGPDYIIPKNTPFTLTATGSDPDGDALSYLWEQVDAGGASYPNPLYSDLNDGQLTTRPIFRPIPLPSPTPALPIPSRTFPSLTYILGNMNVPPPTMVEPGTGQTVRTGESLPQVGRAMNFRVTARAITSVGLPGGVANDSVRIEVDGGTGPFLVTSQSSNVTWAGGEQREVTWSVNGTNNLNGGQFVKIRLSIDGGINFTHDVTPVGAAQNDGSAMIIVPLGLNSTSARVKVEADGNIFFDISDVNFMVTLGCGSSINPTGQNVSAGFSTGTVGVTIAAGCSWTAASNVNWLAVTSGASGTGNGTVGYAVAANHGAARTGMLAIAGQTFTVMQAAGTATNGLQFYPLSAPVRLLETRAGFSGCNTPGMAINAGSTFPLPAQTGCSGVPASAAAVTGNITVVPSAAGNLTLFPSNVTQPTVANSNFAAGEVTNNVFTVGLGAADGAFKIFTNATTEVIIDVTGYYAPPGITGLYFHPLATPVRLLETRAGFSGCFAPGTPLAGTGNPNADPSLDLAVQGRSPIPSPCNSIPDTAQVLVGNATSVLPSGGGYLTIYPSGGARPSVASSNYAGSDVINGPFAVKLGTDGKFKVYTYATTHLVIDILGYYSAEAVDAGGAGLLFNPLPSPVRLLETRPDFPGFPLTGCTRTNAKIPGNLAMATHTQSAGNFCGLPATAQAVVGNVTVVNSEGVGYLTLFPANLTTAPSVATSNYPMPATFGYNRHYFVGLSPTDGKFKALTQFTTDLILDASGYFAP